MTSTRRNFIRTCTGGVVAGVSAYLFPAEARARYIVPTDDQGDSADERFWEVVREQFPLQRDPIFFNNGTIGPSPYVVIDAVRQEMEDVDRTARYGGWEDVRGKVAGFVNAREDEIALTHNVTEGISIVAAGLPLKSGDEVIVTDHEHAGNAIPWLARARRDGVVIKVLHLAPAAEEVLRRCEQLITRRTRVIAVPHITCTIGQILPAREISALARRRGIWVMIDAAHTPGMIPLDVKALECDFLATCGHKWMMGPKGTGFLYVRSEAIELLEPYWAGAGSDTAWDVLTGSITYKANAGRFDFATQNSGVFVGLGSAIDFLTLLRMEKVSARNLALASHLRRGLKKLGSRIDILTPEEPGSFGAVVAFRSKVRSYDELHKLLLEDHHFITRMVPENGIDCNRISTHIYNSMDEVERFLHVMQRIS